MMLRVKPTEVEPAGIVTEAVAGWASVVSLDVMSTVVLTVVAMGRLTVPLTVPVDSEAEAGSVTVSTGMERVNAEEVPEADPFVAVSVALPVPSTETLPVHPPLENAPVEAGVTETAVVDSEAVPVKPVAGWLSTVRALIVTEKEAPEERGEAIVLQVK